MAVHLIETSEEDSYLAVARHISDLLNEGQVSRRLAIHHLRTFCHIHHFKLFLRCVHYTAPSLHPVQRLLGSVCA